MRLDIFPPLIFFQFFWPYLQIKFNQKSILSIICWFTIAFIDIVFYADFLNKDVSAN